MSGSYRAEQVLADPSRFGFVTAAELAEIADEEPLRRVLVRCSCGRFVTGARDAREFIEIINKSGKQYVRDVTLSFKDGE